MPQIKRPNREVKPLRRESPGLQRGPVGRAQPISKNEKPAGSRERDLKGKGKDEKVRRLEKEKLADVLSFAVMAGMLVFM